jgi:hypothetical protein
MSDHKIHDGHDHIHGPGCGHKTIMHDGHQDYLHDGHLHHVHGDHVDEHVLSARGKNPAACTTGHACQSHDAAHVHGASCGHEAVPHGDHVDYHVDGHLHHVHDGHCDDHGQVHIA